MSFFQRGPENGNLTHMRFFVAGATGYTGRSLVVLAASRGVTVTAHIRPDSANVGACKAAFEADGVTVCVAQWSPDLMGDAVALARPTHVYGLLGTTAAKARAAARGPTPIPFTAFAPPTLPECGVPQSAPQSAPEGIRSSNM